MAHMVAAGHWAMGATGFVFVIFGITWAWINYAWCASAFDTDDWAYRLLTMVQMIGVVIFALGLAPFFHSLEGGEHVDNRTMVLGYVVMRAAMLVQWLRAAAQCPESRTTARLYAVTLAIAQVGWVALGVANTSLGIFLGAAGVLSLVEMSGPYLAETRTNGTPWHAHHIAERYSLLVIVTLGEGVVGAVVSLEALLAAQGWELTTAAFVFASMGLTFGMWWIYFVVPFGEILHHRPERGFVFGYGHIVVFGAIAAVGAGLHVMACYLEAHHDPEEFGWVHISQAGAVLAVALPVMLFFTFLIAIWRYLFRSNDRLHTVEFLLTVATLIGAVALAAAHVSLTVCLLVIALAPAIVVVGYEVAGGHEKQAAALEAESSGSHH